MEQNNKSEAEDRALESLKNLKYMYLSNHNLKFENISVRFIETHRNVRKRI